MWLFVQCGCRAAPAIFPASAATTTIATLRIGTFTLSLPLGSLRESQRLSIRFWGSRGDSRWCVVCFKYMEVFNVTCLDRDKGEHFVARGGISAAYYAHATQRY